MILCASVVGADIDPILGGDVDPGEEMRSVSWLYDSPLTVYETITDLGGGSYLYSYQFQNVDSSIIWNFGVYDSFGTQPLTQSSWTGYPTWSYSQGNVDEVFDFYNPDNIDSSINFVAYTWDWNDATGIQPGETVEGFSYIDYEFDPNPKLYFYETSDSGYANENGGFVAAIGWTFGDVTASEGITWSSLKALY